MLVFLVHSLHVLGHMVHDVLGVNLIRAQDVNVVILSCQSPVLSPGVLRLVASNHLNSSRVILQPRKRTLLLDRVFVAIPLYLPGVEYLLIFISCYCFNCLTCSL